MKNVPRIERTLTVKLPDGQITTVNRFDYNIAHCVDAVVELDNTVHIKARALIVVKANSARDDGTAK